MAADRNETGNARPWLTRAIIVALAMGLALFVRAQIADSAFRVEQTPQRVMLTDELLPPPEEEEIEMPDERPEEIVEAEEPDELSELDDDAIAPLDEMLGLDAEGVAGADAFGLMARQGGTDLLRSDRGGCDWYTTVLNDELNTLLVPILSEHDALLDKNWSVVMKLWLEPDGKVDNFEVSSTGNASLDSDIYAALGDFRQVSTPPPPDLPQPIRLRLRCQS